MTTGINSSQRISLSDTLENVTGYANPMQLDLLTKEVWKLEKRLSRVEERLESNIRRTSFSLSTSNESIVGEKGDFHKPTCGCELREARKFALATVNHNLISHKPYNIDFFSEVWNVFVVMKRNPFSCFQFLLMFFMVSALSVFIIISFRSAHNSNIETYKPVKIEAQSEYFQSKELTYQIPPHWLIFDIYVRSDSFNERYYERFGHDCTDTVANCLRTYLSHLLSVEKYAYGVGCKVLGVAGCYTHQPNGTMYVFPRNITISIESFGQGKLIRFLVTLKIEFDDIDETWNDEWFHCTFELMVNSFNRAMNFSFFDVYFTVSRTDYFSRVQIQTKALQSVWPVYHSWEYNHNISELVHSNVDQLKSMLFQYQESTLDGISDFELEVYQREDSNGLGISTVASPTVIHHVSYVSYSYNEWLADVGGVFTLLTTLFFVLAKVVTNYANRNDPFRRRHGILPVISKTYRNAEELAGLRCLVLSAFGISEEAYFADEFDVS